MLAEIRFGPDFSGPRLCGWIRRVGSRMRWKMRDTFHGMVGSTTCVACMADPCDQDRTRGSTSCHNFAEERLRGPRKQQVVNKAMALDTMTKNASERPQLRALVDEVRNAVEMDHSEYFNQHRWI